MLLWVIFWKGMALWRSARLGQKWWFIVLLVVNTFGILEIFYIYVFSKKQAALHKARRSEDIVHENHHAHTTEAGLFENDQPVSEDLPAQAGKPVEEKKESTNSA